MRSMAVLLSFVLSLSVFFSQVSHALCQEYEVGLQCAWLDRYYERPRYELGGKPPDTTDCSEFYQAGCRDAGIPDTGDRTQAWVICAGKGPYANRPVPRGLNGKLRRGDMLCFKFPRGLIRPGANHIAGIIEVDGNPKVIHASSSRGTVAIDDLDEPWIRANLMPYGVKRMTAGE